MARVMVVDDDVTVREVVTSYLRANRHHTVESGYGEQALLLYRQEPVDLVVLDLVLPGMDGHEVTRRLRAIGDVPIIMLSARGGEDDRIAGLRLGADDYLGKPFSPRELVARVESVLRRNAGPSAAGSGVLRDGDLVIDTDRHTAYLDDEQLVLTVREFALLQFLVANPHTAFTREEMLQHVWGWTVGDRSTVTVHVRRLREKVERDPTRPSRLITVWGVGYRWEPAR